MLAFPICAALVQPPRSSWTRRVSAALLSSAGAFIATIVVVTGMVSMQARLNLEWIAATSCAGFAFFGFMTGIANGFRSALVAALAFGVPALVAPWILDVSEDWYLMILLACSALIGGPALAIMATRSRHRPGVTTSRQRWKLAAVLLFLLVLFWLIFFYWFNLRTLGGPGQGWYGKSKAKEDQEERLEEQRQEAIRRGFSATDSTSPPKPFPPPQSNAPDPLQ